MHAHTHIISYKIMAIAMLSHKTIMGLKFRICELLGGP